MNEQQNNNETALEQNNKYPKEKTPQGSEKIVIQNAYKIYRRGEIDVVALRGLSCTFYKGELSVIMGPSGCGKTTLLNMIGGLDRLNSGRIFVDGMDICQLSDKALEQYRRDKVGFVFQFSNLIPELKAIENIKLPLQLTGRMNKKREEYIQELVRIVGLEERIHHRPDELSGGEQQRVSVAAALANDPEIILCDEPTGELDSQTKLVIMQLLRRIIDMYPEKSMIVVSHDPDFRLIADRVFYIRDGFIEHEIYGEDLEKLRKQSEGYSQVSTEQLNEEAVARRIIKELTDVDLYVKNKIKNWEKKHFPT